MRRRGNAFHKKQSVDHPSGKEKGKLTVKEVRGKKTNTDSN